MPSVTDEPAGAVFDPHHLQIILDHASVMLVELDPQGRYRLCLGRVQERFGIDPLNVIGRPVKEVRADMPELVAAADRALAGDPARVVVEHAGCTFEVDYAPIRDEAGRVEKVIGIAFEVTERARLGAELAESESRFASLITNMRDIVFCHGQAGDGPHGYDADGVQILGRDVARFAGQVGGSGPDVVERWYATVHPDDLPGYRAADRARKRDGTTFSVEYRITHPDSRELRWMHEVGWAVDEPATGRRWFDGYIIDVTEQKRRELKLLDTQTVLASQTEAMRKLVTLAEEASRAKSSFFAKMSHEIRTPMNALLGFAELLASSELTAEQRRFVDIVRGAGRQLLSVLNDVLDFSKLEAGKMEFETVAFRLHELLETTRPTTEMLLAEKAVAFQLRIGAGVPSAVRGDPNRLRQILSNLLGNAAKFTKQGSVTLSVDRVPGEDADACLLFKVVDTGIGVEPAQHERLFRAFSQVDTSTSRHFGGTGLGLAIAHELVGCMGGRIGVESEPGRGSTFWFELPCAVAEPGEIVPELDGVPVRAARQLDVLVVDDVATNRELILALVERHGHKVRLATNGVEAIAAVAAACPDIVLMDINMPVMDGVEATRHIRAFPPPAGIVPIVALTAHTLAVEIEAFRSGGMDDHLIKPIDALALYATLAHYAGGGFPDPTAAPAPAAQPVAAPPSADAGAPVLDRVRLDALGGKIGRKQLAAMLGRAFVNIGRDLAQLEHHLADAEAAGVAEVAHRLAGLGGSVGLPALSQHARSLELLAAAGELGPGARQGIAALIDIHGRAAAEFAVFLAEDELPAQA